MDNDALGNSEKKHTIMIVDDEEMVLDVGKAILEMLGHTVIAATSGEEALENYAQHQQEVECVILDLTMPGISGKEAYKRLRELNPDLPIIIASGMAVEQVVADFAESNVTSASVIQKPYQIADLTGKIQGLL